MLTRRAMLQTGLGYTVLTIARPRMAFGSDASQPAGFQRGLPASAPLARAEGLDHNVMVAPLSAQTPGRIALPFHADFTGDMLPQSAHVVLPNKFLYLDRDGQPPRPDEFVDVAVIGGGLGGLTSAYELRHRNPVVLEYASRFGGNSKGETWAGVPYSMGGAYMIETCPGTALDQIIRDLGLLGVVRPYEGDDAIEFGGSIVKDFWKGAAGRPEDKAKYAEYKKRMLYYANEAYPDMPTPDGTLDATTQDLDQRTLQDEITGWLGGDVPDLLAAAVQMYCFSSFCAGWQETSAASGINFLAAEEYPLWVFPGGLAQVSHRLWRSVRDAGGADRLRPGTFVFDVRMHAQGVQITYMDSSQTVRSMVAKAVVVSSPQKLYSLMHDNLPQPRVDAIGSLKHRSYMVANILLDHAIEDAFYDLFLLRDGNVPMDEEDADARTRIADALLATWVSGVGNQSVLTCYWPLPFGMGALHGRFGSWEDGSAEHKIRTMAAGQIHDILEVLDVDPKKVRQIRLNRWGHSMPVSPPGFYNAGTHNLLREPIDGRIFFAHQDNWALPAIETTMLEAIHFAPQADAVVAG